MTKLVFDKDRKENITLDGELLPTGRRRDRTERTSGRRRGRGSGGEESGVCCGEEIWSGCATGSPTPARDLHLLFVGSPPFLHRFSIPFPSGVGKSCS